MPYNYLQVEGSTTTMLTIDEHDVITRLVCANSHDAEDAKVLLMSLGLIESPPPLQPHWRDA